MLSQLIIYPLLIFFPHGGRRELEPRLREMSAASDTVTLDMAGSD